MHNSINLVLLNKQTNKQANRHRTLSVLRLNCNIAKMPFIVCFQIRWFKSHGFLVQLMSIYITFGPVSIYLYYNSALNNRSQHEALGSNYRICGVYFPDSYAEVYCFRLNLIYQNRAINTFNQRFHKCKKKPHLALVYLI